MRVKIAYPILKELVDDWNNTQFLIDDEIVENWREKHQITTNDLQIFKEDLNVKNNSELILYLITLFK